MRPNDPVFTGGGSYAERRFFEALREELSDEWYVYHRLPYYNLRGGSRCGEIDFLLLHAEHGMLVVECKGSGVRFSQGEGKWYRKVGGGGGGRDGGEVPMGESPVRQAERQLYDFTGFLERQLPARFPDLERFPLVHGFATAFPLAGRFSSPYPSDMPPELTFTADDRGHLAEKAVSILAKRAERLRPRPSGLQGKRFKIFRKHILRPAFQLAAGIGGQVADDDQTFVRMTELQAGIVRSYLENRVIRVRGGAGTGKTVLAIEAAQQLAEAGERVLLLCFNRSLGAYFAARADRWAFEKGRIMAIHFHGLCVRAHGGEGPVFRPPVKGEASDEEVSRFWNEEAPQVLWQAIEAGRIGPFDSIVVDEGQDFESDWWTVLADALASHERSRFLIFYDPAQDLFGRSTELPAGASFVLQDNFRNTRLITEVVNRLGFEPLSPHLLCPTGEPPILRVQGSPAVTRRELDALVRRLCGAEGFAPEQITLLTPRTREHSCLSELQELADMPLAHSPHDRDGKLLHCTVGRFKGLESDVVILLDIDPSHSRSGREVRYCGASRAKHLLYVFIKGSWDDC